MQLVLLSPVRHQILLKLRPIIILNVLYLRRSAPLQPIITIHEILKMHLELLPFIFHLS